MKRKIITLASLFFAIIFTFTLADSISAKPKINKKKLTMNVSSTYRLKLKGVKGKINWKSSKPKVAKVNKKGKVTALKEGKAVITAKFNKNKYKCNIYVRGNSGENESNKVDTITITTTANPVVTQIPLQTSKPTDTPIITPQPMQTPTVTSEPVYQSILNNCMVTDIGEDYITVMQILPTKRECTLCIDTLSLKVKYKGELLVDRNDSAHWRYDFTGEDIAFSDIKMNDALDVIVQYDIQDKPIEEQSLKCLAINVTEHNDDVLNPTVFVETVFYNCNVVDIADDYITVTKDNDTDTTYKIIIDEFHTEKSVLNGEIINHSSKEGKYDCTLEGNEIAYSDIHIGDNVDIILLYALDSPQSMICEGINVNR